MDAPTLTGRMARCACGRTNPSDQAAPGFKDLPFFEFRGEGSDHATKCCTCGFHEVAHTPEKRARGIACDTFTPRGPHDFDGFYCGCRGWD